MCFTLQRYKIESNSQHLYLRLSVYFRCVSHCKDTKLKAIHNIYTWGYPYIFVVFHTAKIQNWKQFTTHWFAFRCSYSLCFTLQRYKIESNSQLPWSLSYTGRCCVSHCKDTKLKAIHNMWQCHLMTRFVVFHTAKIQNWKQFTTLCDTFISFDLLCFTLQRYKIESNSQQISVSWNTFISCVSHCKDTKLKAIHNPSTTTSSSSTVVFYTAKIQNWKQFTTPLFT